MAGVTLDTFVDVFLGTSQAVLTGPRRLLNEAQRRTTLLKLIMNSHEFDTMLQGGDQITDQVIFQIDRTYGAYNPLTPKTPRLANHLTEIKVDWAFSDAHVSFSKHEKGINGINDFKREVRAMKFKDVIEAKWNNLFVDINNGMDRELLAVPDSTTMETVTAPTTRQPMSIFATIHEFGAASSQSKPVATVPPGFTTLQTIAPATQPLWVNPVEYYATGGPIDNGTDTTAATWTLQRRVRWDGFQAFSRMYNRLKYDELAIRPEYGESHMPEGYILASLRGCSLYETNQAAAPNYMRHNDPAHAMNNGLVYNGVPIMYIEGLDTAGVWKDGAGTGFAGEFDASVDENGAALGEPEFEGPRFVWFVPKYFKKIMHRDHFLEEERPPASKFEPYERTVYFDCWHQTFNRSRQRAGGVVAPSADVLTGF